MVVMRGSLTKLQRAVAALAAAALLAPAMIYAVERITFKPGFNLYSPSQDIQLGRQNAAEADKELHLVKDAQVVDYVNNLGKQLVHALLSHCGCGGSRRDRVAVAIRWGGDPLHARLHALVSRAARDQPRALSRPASGDHHA